MIRRRPLIYIPTPVVVGGFSHLKAIDFNGTDEIMRNTTNHDLSIANAWTLMTWIKPTGTVFNNEEMILDIAPNPDSGINIIILTHFGTNPNDPFQVQINNSDGTALKAYGYNNLIVGDVWQQLVITWDGTTLLTYKNASPITPDDLVVDDSVTMTNTDRSMNIARYIEDGSTNWWKGRMHSLALWSVTLSAGNVTSIYNSGVGSTFDLSTIQGASLQHWWQLGKEEDIGFDGGVGTAIDINANSANITEGDDAVTDSPS